MGCTSSAPNTIPPNASTADKSIQFEEETNDHPSTEVGVADIEDESRTGETKVLPTCDTFEETVQLVRNNKSSISLMTEKDVPANGHVNASESAIKIPENVKEEVKIPKLELFMDKVFESNQHLIESEQKVNENEKTPVSKEESVESTEKKDEKTNTTDDPESSDNTDVENNPDGAPEEIKESSPSQSQSSRATRWEALADIAAELPPSLAVDPVTGQIYQIGLCK